MTIGMVVQLGLATMPAVVLQRVGVHLGDDEGDVVGHAPLGGVVDDHGAGVHVSGGPIRS